MWRNDKFLKFQIECLKLYQIILYLVLKPTQGPEPHQGPGKRKLTKIMFVMHQ